MDGYSGFKGLLAGRPPERIKLAFCWAHCRRRFYEIHQATGSPLAAEALRRIGELYAIEAEVRGRPPEERVRLRQARAKPILDDLGNWLDAQLPRISLTFRLTNHPSGSTVGRRNGGHLGNVG